MSQQRYLVAARKYRPLIFGELVAQEHVTETLKNAIRLDRMAHAYLFSGPRGVGKTTAARILAKAINCTTPLAERTDESEPCRRCDSCRSFEEGRSLSIIEIDAASNNKVDDIRDLRDTVRVPPQGSRKKVYIIDEVHMLSNAAFNALLKTLEEPPPYILFIFATTEPHKVIPTILSRCQRFDFRRIPVPDIIGQLRTITEAEQLQADEASLMLIARKGDGALRDALSAFDQAVSLCGTELRYAELAKALGVVASDLYFDVTTLVRQGSGAGMLQMVESIVRAGYDLHEFLIGLAEHMRNLLVARTTGGSDLIEATEATRERYLAEARHFAEPDLLRLLTMVAEAEEALKASTQPRLHLELALLKMASLPHAADLRALLDKLDRLEQASRDGLAPAAPAREAPAARTPPGTPGPVPQRNTPRPTTPPDGPAAGSREQHAPPPSLDRPAGPAAARATGTPAAIPPDVFDEDEPADEAPFLSSSEPVPAPSRAPVAVGPPAADATPPPQPSTPVHPLFGPPALNRSGRRPSDGGAGKAGLAGTEPGEPALSLTVDAPAPATAATERVVAEVVAAPPARLSPVYEAAWAACVKAVSSERIHVGTVLRHAQLEAVQAGMVTIAVPDEFQRRLLDNQHDYLLGHLSDALGQKVDRLVLTLRAALTTDEPETPEAFDAAAYLQRKREESPVLKALFDQFGGEIVW